jgi:lysophospholipase L1-like esterase
MHKTMTRILIAAVLLSFSMAALAAAETGPMLKQGDRMVFLGDSITEQRIYTAYVMDYFALRYPDLKVTFRNAGWGGDRAPGALARLQRDVLDLKPNVVSICLGMNDGQYARFDQAVYDTYIEAMKGLVSGLKQAGVRVVLLSPGCVDPLDKKRLEGYNDTLARYAAGVVELGRIERLPTANLHELMIGVQTAAKADHPEFTMIPDGVHPSGPGHALMAFGLLYGLKCSGGASALTIDAAAKSVQADRCVVQGLKISDDAISFRRTDDALPTYFDPEVAGILQYAPFLSAMNDYSLTIKGLKAGQWKVAVNGIDVGTFSADELAGRVDLSGRPGPWQTIAKEVHRLSRQQETYYFTRWRRVQLSDFPPETKRETDALIRKLDSLVSNCETARAKAVANRTWDWSVIRVGSCESSVLRE